MAPSGGEFKLGACADGSRRAIARGIAVARASESTRPIRVGRHSSTPSGLDASSGPRSRISRRRSTVLRTRLVEFESGVVVPGQIGCRLLGWHHVGLSFWFAERRCAREGMCMSRHSKIRRATSGSVIADRIRIRPPHAGQRSASTSKTRCRRSAQAVRRRRSTVVAGWGTGACSWLGIGAGDEAEAALPESEQAGRLPEPSRRGRPVCAEAHQHPTSAQSSTRLIPTPGRLMRSR